MSDNRSLTMESIKQELSQELNHRAFELKCQEELNSSQSQKSDFDFLSKAYRRLARQYHPDQQSNRAREDYDSRYFEAIQVLFEAAKAQGPDSFRLDRFQAWRPLTSYFPEDAAEDVEARVGQLPIYIMEGNYRAFQKLMEQGELSEVLNVACVLRCSKEKLLDLIKMRYLECKGEELREVMNGIIRFLLAISNDYERVTRRSTGNWPSGEITENSDWLHEERVRVIDSFLEAYSEIQAKQYVFIHDERTTVPTSVDSMLEEQVRGLRELVKAFDEGVTPMKLIFTRFSELNNVYGLTVENLRRLHGLIRILELVRTHCPEQLNASPCYTRFDEFRGLLRNDCHHTYLELFAMQADLMATLSWIVDFNSEDVARSQEVQAIIAALKSYASRTKQRAAAIREPGARFLAGMDAANVGSQAIVNMLSVIYFCYAHIVSEEVRADLLRVLSDLFCDNMQSDILRHANILGMVNLRGDRAKFKVLESRIRIPVVDVVVSEFCLNDLALRQLLVTKNREFLIRQQSEEKPDIDNLELLVTLLSGYDEPLSRLVETIQSLPMRSEGSGSTIPVVSDIRNRRYPEMEVTEGACLIYRELNEFVMGVDASFDFRSPEGKRRICGLKQEIYDIAHSREGSGIGVRSAEARKIYHEISESMLQGTNAAMPERPLLRWLFGKGSKAVEDETEASVAMPSLEDLRDPEEGADAAAGAGPEEGDDVGPVKSVR